MNKQQTSRYQIEFPNLYTLDSSLAAAIYHIREDTLPLPQIQGLAKNAAIIASKMNLGSTVILEAQLQSNMNNISIQQLERRAGEIRSNTNSQSRGENLGLFTDYLHDQNLLPDNVRMVLDRFSKEEPSQEVAMQLEYELSNVGYAISYDPAGELHNLRPAEVTPQVAEKAVGNFMRQFKDHSARIHSNPEASTALLSIENYINGCENTGQTVNVQLIEERVALCEVYIKDCLVGAPEVKEKPVRPSPQTDRNFDVEYPSPTLFG